jgi:hypothetical protein
MSTTPVTPIPAATVAAVVAPPAPTTLIPATVAHVATPVHQSVAQRLIEEQRASAAAKAANGAHVLTPATEHINAPVTGVRAPTPAVVAPPSHVAAPTPVTKATAVRKPLPKASTAGKLPPW